VQQVSNNWAALQRLLVRCVLPSLGAQQQASQQHMGIVPGGGLRDLGGAPLPAQQVRPAATEHATLVADSNSLVCQIVHWASTDLLHFSRLRWIVCVWAVAHAARWYCLTGAAAAAAVLQGYAMLLACPAVSKAPWPMQLYFCR
jgi:hypothetical protein